jgi:hypothetical protein
VRALLDLMRENRAAVQDILAVTLGVLCEASADLKVLDPELGEEELVKAVAVEVAKLRGGYM